MTLYRQAGSVLSARNVDGGFVLDLGRARCFGLNGVAAAIWSALEAKQSLEDISKDIAETCGVPQDQVSLDVRDFVKALVQEGLVTRIDEP